jgi:tRNA A58 N-methylase Trm61
MLELASVTKDDIVCDLGSGDGRIVITAAREYGCRAVGYEIDRDLVALSQENVANSGLTELVKIEHEDIFTRELSGNTVITVFLYPRLMDRLLPQLNRMKPGSRVVSHHFVFSDIPPDRTLKIESKEDGIRHDIHLWKVPLQAGK